MWSGEGRVAMECIQDLFNLMAYKFDCGMHVELNLMMCKFVVPLSPLQSLLLPYYSVWTHNIGGDSRKDVLVRTICVSAVVFVHTAEFVLPS